MASNMRITAAGSSALAASPYTVSVGIAISPPRCRMVAHSAIAGVSGLRSSLELTVKRTVLTPERYTTGFRRSKTFGYPAGSLPDGLKLTQRKCQAFSIQTVWTELIGERALVPAQALLHFLRHFIMLLHRGNWQRPLQPSTPNVNLPKGVLWANSAWFRSRSHMCGACSDVHCFSL